MEPTPETTRLSALRSAAFYELLTAFVAAHWGVPETALDAASPSPDRSVEIRLPDGTFAAAFQYAPTAVVSERAIRDLVSVGAGVAITTAGFAPGAKTLAERGGIGLIDGGRFVDLLAEYEITIPESEDRDLESIVEGLSSYWSADLAATAREVAETIDAAGSFEYGLSRADYSTDLDVVPAGETEPAAKLRFSSAGLRLYVRRDGWERVVGVSAHGEHVPSDLREQIRRAVEPLG